MTKQQKKLFNVMHGDRYLLKDESIAFGIHYDLYDADKMISGPYPKSTVSVMIRDSLLIYDGGKIRRNS